MAVPLGVAAAAGRLALSSAVGEENAELVACCSSSELEATGLALRAAVAELGEPEARGEPDALKLPLGEDDVDGQPLCEPLVASEELGVDVGRAGEELAVGMRAADTVEFKLALAWLPLALDETAGDRESEAVTEGLRDMVTEAVTVRLLLPQREGAGDADPVSLVLLQGDGRAEAEEEPVAPERDAKEVAELDPLPLPHREGTTDPLGDGLTLAQLVVLTDRCAVREAEEEGVPRADGLGEGDSEALVLAAREPEALPEVEGHCEARGEPLGEGDAEALSEGAGERLPAAEAEAAEEAEPLRLAEAQRDVESVAEGERE